MRTTYRFDEVSVKGVRRWTDADGRKRQETRKFSQTINPFNKDENGNVKDRETIMKENIARRDAWLAGAATRKA